MQLVPLGLLDDELGVLVDSFNRMTDELREMIVARRPIRELKDVARRGGTTFLRDAALALVREGRTDLEEINRVTFVA